MHGSDDVRSGTRRSNTDNRVFIIDVMFHQFFPATGCIIFGILYRVTKGYVPTGNQPDDQCGRHTESWRYFRSVKYSQASACSGTHIEYTSSLLHARHDLAYQFLYLRNGLLCGKGYFLVFRIDVFQYFPDRLFL